MMKHSTVPTLALALLLAGCGSGSDSSDGSGSHDSGSADSGTCAFDSAPPELPPVDHSTVQATAESEGRAKLDLLVGRFLRREAVVYHGTIEAHDTQGLGQPPPPPGQAGATDQMLPEQSAIAGLTRGNDVLLAGNAFTGADVLVVHGVTSHQYVQFSQVDEQPGITWVGVILGDTSSGGNVTSCTDCILDFAALPADIAFESVSATSTIPVTDGSGMTTDVTLEVVASAALAEVELCDLTFADLLAVGSPGSLPLPFVEEGGEMVLHDSGVADIPPASQGQCGGTAYTIDLYVNLSDLADYGVRNFEAGETGVTCPP